MEIKRALDSLRKSVEKRSVMLLQLSLGIVFLWFGLLKFFDASPAEDIASKTLTWLTFGYVKAAVSLPILAAVECAIGLGIITKRLLKYVTPVLYLQMAGTMLPLLIFRSETWAAPFVPTMEGQYIIKNIVLIAAALTLNAAAKGRIRKPM
jgi:uncharacterized membrane protein YkgB